MLIDIETRRAITRVPHLTEYRRWLARLSLDEIEAIRSELYARISGDEIHVSSWMPGADWTGTVFQPIYEKACTRNATAAALCFGLMLWEVMMDRDDAWAFGRYPVKGVDVRGLTYFRVQP